MQNPNYYGGVIWTNHALQRLKERRLPQKMVLETFNAPDNRFNGKQPGTLEYEKRIGNYFVTLIAKQNERKEWLILSCWVEPPLPGSIDIPKKQRYYEYKRASFWGRILLDLKHLVGL